MTLKEYIKAKKIQIVRDFEGTINSVISDLNENSSKLNDFILILSGIKHLNDRQIKNLIDFSESDIILNKLRNSSLVSLDQLIEDDIQNHIIDDKYREIPKINLNSHLLDKITPFMKMTNWHEIYQKAIMLVENAEMRIQATSFGTGEWKGNEEYFHAMASNIKKQKEKNNEILYKLVVNSEQNKVKDNISKRIDIFKEYDVEDNIIIKAQKENWGIDLLIVDYKHLHISFQNVINRALFIGVEIINSPALVAPISRWYDELLFEKSQKL